MAKMAGFFVALVGMFWAFGPAAAQSTGPNAMACITLSELRATDTPPRLARAVRNCIQQERYDDAMQVFLAYSVFGTFDQQRVRDESGHVAFVELNIWIFGGYRREIVEELKLVSARLREKGEFFRVTCDGIRAAGWPDYRPSYMIERGIMPRKTEEDWVTDGFSAAAAWENSLTGVNGCPAG